MRLVTDPGGWDGTWPVASIGAAASAPARRALLRAVAAAVFGSDPDAVRIAHEEGRAPRLVRPARSGLHLSCASRDGLAAAAAGPDPIGIDIERVDAAGEVPWGVLHPAEAATLRDTPPGERPAAFARLWTCKEAYLKALGTGLAREPSSVQVAFVDGERAGVCAPASGCNVVVQSAWTRWGDAVFCVSICCVKPAG